MVGNMDTKTATIIGIIIIVVVIGAAFALKGGGAPQTTSAPASTETKETSSTTSSTTTTSTLEMTTPPDTLVIAMDTSDAVSLDPAQAYEMVSCFVVNQLYDKLVDYQLPDLQHIKPEVAESWDVKDNGTVWIFHIRHNITFANGDTLTADDVVYSLRRVVKLGKSPSWVFTQFVSDPNNIQKIDDYTVKIVLDHPVAPSFFLSTLTFTTTAIVDKKVVEAHEQNGDMGNAWLTYHSAGSGPYILDHWTKEQEIVLVANEHYWKGVPHIKKIIIKHVPEPTDQLLLLKKGDVDIAWDLTVDQLDQLKSDPTIQFVGTPMLTIHYLGMNVAVKPLDNENVRNAVRYCIDYNAITNDILRGQAINWQTIIPEGVLGALKKTPFYRNVTLAKELLAKAGYPNGFTITLTTPPNSPYIDIATLIQSNLADCGIKVNIEQVTQSEMYQKYRKQGLQMVLAAWGTDYPDPDDNAKAFADYRVKQLAWRNSWYDDYAANLTEKAGLEPDVQKRVEMYKELQEYVLYHGPYAILYQEYRTIATKKWVHGFVPDPTFFLEDLSTVYKG
jgi:peptide/nickel transport system substrate-binding protein